MKKNIIIISSVDWNDNYQMHHQLTESFEKEGSNVLFIENTGVRSLKFQDIKRIFSRLFNWLKYSRGFKKKSFSVNILSPIILPFPFSRLAVFVNSLILKKSINNYLKFKKINNFIVITFLPSPLIESLLKKIKPDQLYYYCANEMIIGSKQKKILLKSEKYIIQKSNAVFTISENLYNKIIKNNKFVYHFPPGVDFKKFNKVYDNNFHTSFLSEIKKPIIGYIGSISKVFDFDLMIKIIETFKNCKIVIIGKIYENNYKLKYILSKDNVIFINQLSHAELPNYLKYFNVGLIPYVINEFTNSVSACKLNEYLSLGIPIVSTNIKEINNFNQDNENVIFTNKDNNNLIQYIDRIINSKIDIKHSKYIQIAKNNDWDSRFKNIVSIINNNIKISDYSDWNLVFLQSVKNFWNNFFKVIFIIIIINLAIFKSPLFWFIGNNLVVSDNPSKSSAIVIFSGNGKTGYTNTGYQNRALDAVNLYKNNFSKKIILTSGRLQTISEGEMISSYLLSKGLSINSFVLIKNYPKSTYDNVMITYKYLIENNINDIILLTAPYHTKRSKLIWSKVAPNIKVIFPKSSQYDKEIIKWSFSINEIKIILYEIAAIFYNKYKKYL